MKTYLVSIYVAFAPPANAEPVKMDWRVMPSLIERHGPITQEKCLELANDFIIPGQITHHQIESLVRSAVCLGLEMAAKECEERDFLANASHLAYVIRKLKDEVQRGE